MGSLYAGGSGRLCLQHLHVQGNTFAKTTLDIERRMLMGTTWHARTIAKEWTPTQWSLEAVQCLQLRRSHSSKCWPSVQELQQLEGELRSLVRWWIGVVPGQGPARWIPSFLSPHILILFFSEAQSKEPQSHSLLWLHWDYQRQAPVSKTLLKCVRNWSIWVAGHIVHRC